MIGPNRDDCIVRERAGVEGVEQFAHLGVHETDAAQVVLDGSLPLAGVAGLLHVKVLAEG